MQSESLAMLADVLERPLATPWVEAVDDTIDVLGVEVRNLNVEAAIEKLETALKRQSRQPATLYFVNAHTLNVAHEDPDYRQLLNRATYVFGDGTGVRWAARIAGVKMRANLNGTDLMPALFAATAGRGYSYYLLGTTGDSIRRAATAAEVAFPGWQLAGYHDGYLDHARTEHVIAELERLRPHMLLVGMGNPIQERWIDRYRERLAVRLCVGVGGLFNHWAGDLKRAPRWVRWLGYEWLQLLLQQPHKWRRYLLGNPRYLARVCRQRYNTWASPGVATPGLWECDVP